MFQTYQKPQQQTCRRLYAQTRDLYQVLGVAENASEAELKKAYRQKVKVLHPDVNKAPDAAQKFIECKKAYEILSNQSSRREYQNTKNGYSGYQGFSGRSERQTQQRYPQEKEYSFSEMLNDIGNEVSKAYSDFSAEGRNKSIWEELESLGEDFLDTVEKTLGITPDMSKDIYDDFFNYKDQKYSQYQKNGTQNQSKANYNYNDNKSKNQNQAKTQNQNQNQNQNQYQKKQDNSQQQSTQKSSYKQDVKYYDENIAKEQQQKSKVYQSTDSIEEELNEIRSRLKKLEKQK